MWDGTQTQRNALPILRLAMQRPHWECKANVPRPTLRRLGKQQFSHQLKT